MTAFDRVWNILKGENIYHSVHIKPRTSEEAQRISDLQTEMLDRGISFDTGGGLDGGRDWELDFSLKGATADEVMAELRAPGIPFQTEMWADTAEDLNQRGPPSDVEWNDCLGCGALTEQPDGWCSIHCENENRVD